MTAKTDPGAEQDAATYTALGYRRVSNRYRHISRIDREDWLDVLARHLRRSPAQFFLPDGGLDGGWCDYYRRVLSKDVITVSESIFRAIPASGHDPVGWVSPLTFLARPGQA